MRKNFYSIGVFVVAMLILISGKFYPINGKAINGKTLTLPKVGSFDNFKSLIDAAYKNQPQIYFEQKDFNFDAILHEMGGSFKKESSSDYSTTNVQVEGVDEGDIIKCDGEFIYYINGNKVQIIKAYPPEKMQIFSQIELEKSFVPKEIFIDENYLAVIGNKYRKDEWEEMDGVLYEGALMPYYVSDADILTYCYIYDIIDKKSPKLLRKLFQAGIYLTSRKIEDNIYLVSNKYIPYHKLKDEEDPKEFMPYYYDSIAHKNEVVYVGFKNVSYIPDFTSLNYTIVGTLSINSNSCLRIEPILGGGEDIYASQNSIYVAAPIRRIVRGIIPDLSFDSNYGPRIVRVLKESTKTVVYKFLLSDSNVIPVAYQTVNGHILNQFSMDEFEGYLRIATTYTEYRSFSGQGFKKTNNLYVLDKDMNIVGKIENIAPGESIYSARFMGKRAYLVTFKALDPFFVVDLNDPKNPKILGCLKIPGYSTYLHPYDDNHIIGFGKDATDLDENWAVPLGLKIAMFDVSDVNNPKELFKIIIGDKGSTSELLQNHKALLFDKNKNIFAFPVTVYEKDDNKNSLPSTFIGAYVYSIDLEKGFTLKGKIAHQSGKIKDIKSGGKIKRLLYINDVLYSISNSVLKANDLKFLTEINSLLLE